MCLDWVFCPPRGSGQETDLWHTGTRSHWGGQYIWLHWGRACWSSRLCRSDTRHRWTLEGTDTEGNQELLEAAHPHSCTVRNYLPANLPSHPNRSSANLHAMASSSTHKHTTSQTWLLIQPTLQRFSLRVKGASAWKLRWPSQTEIKQMELKWWTVCLSVKLRAHQ